MTAPLDPAIATRIRASFAAQSMMVTFGADLVALEPGLCRIAAPILPGCRQQHGHAHAALPFGLGDSACGYAALSLMPAGSEVLTVEMKINLLAPANGTTLIATGEVVKPGRRLMIVRGEVIARAKDGTETRVALLQGTMIPVTAPQGRMLPASAP
jgi:uncharacterized protein (TIGR00369 family)